MATNLPFPTRLFQLLIAFTIEHDNEWELRDQFNADPARIVERVGKYCVLLE